MAFPAHLRNVGNLASGRVFSRIVLTNWQKAAASPRMAARGIYGVPKNHMPRKQAAIINHCHGSGSEVSLYSFISA